ncbi:MAG: hypothetical protein U5R30_09535 [Deltaproteobacteria bacterium]|nr:hypothetical protein [Deltaproteobacteria bacterium]
MFTDGSQTRIAVELFLDNAGNQNSLIETEVDVEDVGKIQVARGGDPAELASDFVQPRLLGHRRHIGKEKTAFAMEKKPPKTPDTIFSSLMTPCVTIFISLNW